MFDNFELVGIVIGCAIVVVCVFVAVRLYGAAMTETLLQEIAAKRRQIEDERTRGR
jgi:hypothetical protein